MAHETKCSKFYQNAAHTRQNAANFIKMQRTRDKFQESGMPECPNRTVLTSFQECSNQTDYQVCLVRRATIDLSVSNESTWFLSEDMWITPTDLQTEEILKRVSAAQKVAMEAKCHKDRRDSRGFDAIRQHLHTRNAAKSYKPHKKLANCQKYAVEAKCHKDRRDSKDIDAIRRHLHTRNAINQLRES